jgi:hypothetical protein
MATTIKELIDLLLGFPPEAAVVLSIDAEGNDFRPLATSSGTVFAWYGPDPGAISHERAEGATRCVVLWPEH